MATKGILLTKTVQDTDRMSGSLRVIHVYHPGEEAQHRFDLEIPCNCFPELEDMLDGSLMVTHNWIQ